MRLAVFGFAAQQDFPFDDSARAGHDAENGERGNALAAAALTDDAECLSKVNVEAGAIHGADHALVGEEACFEVANGQNWFDVVLHGCSGH